MIDTSWAQTQPDVCLDENRSFEAAYSPRRRAACLAHAGLARATRELPDSVRPYASTSLFRRRLAASVAISIVSVVLLICFGYIALNTVSEIHAYNDGAKLAIAAVGLLLIAINICIAFRVMRAHETVVRALYISEERLDLAIEASADGVWDWQGPNAPVYFSPRALHLLARVGDEVPCLEALVESIHPDDRHQARQAFACVGHGCQSVDIEFRLNDPHARFRWLRMRGRELLVSTHARRRIAGLITDISERKREEQRLRETEAEERRQTDDTHIRMLESIQGKIGRELHDDLGQRLTGIAFLMKAMQQRLIETIQIGGTRGYGAGGPGPRRMRVRREWIANSL